MAGRKRKTGATSPRKKKPPSATPVVQVVQTGCACNHQWHRWLNVLANLALVVFNHWSDL
jgi:hypothetical protein